MTKALVFWGGWDGHTPKDTAALLAGRMAALGWDVTVADTLAPLDDGAALGAFDLIVPVWTMGKIRKEQWAGLNQAVRAGAGLAGVHGGMCDAFRENVEYQWMTGGQFVGHPHVGPYEVRRTSLASPITDGLPLSFVYDSEQYYMLVDPGVTVLAETTYAYDGGNVTMPVVWTKRWGRGRVFFSALGHTCAELEKAPDVVAMTIRGFQWAARNNANCGGV